MSEWLTVGGNPIVADESKTMKIVRTVGGARRYGQPKGSIIVRDGKDPLDALVALPNDREGYEKVADLNGNVYYVGFVKDPKGNEKWVVETADGQKAKEANSSEIAFSWLNNQVGGNSATPDERLPDVVLSKPTDTARMRIEKAELNRPEYGLSQAQGASLGVLKEGELVKYRQLRDSGLDHAHAYKLSRTGSPTPTPTPKPKPTPASAKKKQMDTAVEYKRHFTTERLDELGKAGKAFKNHNGDWSYPVESDQDLKNAIQAVGRCAPADRNGLIRYLKRRASALGKRDLIPDQWSGQKDEMDWDMEEKVHGHQTLERAPGKNDNWVESAGGLPAYIEHIAQALHERRGMSISRSIATAINRVKRWAAGLDNVNPDTRVKAIAALAAWNALKAKNAAKRKK